MARKTSNLPTKIYTYGCLPPTEGAELVDLQLRLAWRYRNTLVEIEHKRRERIREIELKHETLSPIIQRLDAIESELHNLYKKIRLTRTDGGPEDRDVLEKTIKSLKSQKSTVWQRLKEERNKFKPDKDTIALLSLCEEAKTRDPHFKRMVRPWQRLGMAVYATVNGDPNVRLWCDYTLCNELANEDRIAARAVCGLSSGTYQVIEKSADDWRTSPEAPRFLRYEGEGRVAVQFNGGMSSDALSGGEDTRLRLMPATPLPTKRNPNGCIKDTYRTIWINIPDKSSRKPKWAKFPMKMHRPLPDDARIMWAWIYRKREGVRYRYELQLSIESKTFLPTEEQIFSRDGTIAIDISAMKTDSGVQVAMWKDSFGSFGKVIIPPLRLSAPTNRGRKQRNKRSWIQKRKLVPNNTTKIDDLKALRSKYLDEIRLSLLSHQPLAPQWYTKATETVSRWRSPARVGFLYRIWQRHDGDKFVYEAVESFLRKDRHLLDWMCNQSRRQRLRRRDLFRNFAASIKKYETVVIVDRNYVREKKSPNKAAASVGREARVLGNFASPGELRRIIREAIPEPQRKEVELPEGTSNVCDALLASEEVMKTRADSLANITNDKDTEKRTRHKKRKPENPAQKDSLASVDVSI